MRHWSGNSALTLLALAKVEGNSIIRRWYVQKNGWSLMMVNASCKKNVFLLDLVCHLVYPAAI
jgi:hypothetical protein